MSQRAKDFYEFGDFKIDSVQRVLMREGELVPLTPKVFDLLLLLIENNGHVVEKEKLMSEIWPGTFVEEGNLTQNISVLRRILGEGAEGRQYIQTIPRRGYRFVGRLRIAAEVSEELIIEEHSRSTIVVEQHEQADAEIARVPDANGQRLLPPQIKTALPELSSKRFILAAGAGLLVLVTAGLLWRSSHRSEQPVALAPIRSIAVLPLKSLSGDTKDDYLGLGIADTIITNVSRIRGLTVRPTSAVRKYVTAETDSLEAARQLKVDSVLDGTVQRSGDRLRVSVNLLRTQDGASVWTDNFDIPFNDIFRMQDDVARQVALRLQFNLKGSEQARLGKRHTSNPAAYDFYTKAMYHFGDRSFDPKQREHTDTAVTLFKKAIELDPNYALAHAQLGYSYAWTAVFAEENPTLIERAKQEISVAEAIDPQLAEVHIVRHFILWSQYEGFQVEAAIRALRQAQQLDPNVGHYELSSLYLHLGLEEQWVKEREMALERDPTSDVIKQDYVIEYLLTARPDESLAAERRFFNREPGIRYYLEKRMLKEAQPLVEQEYAKNPSDPWARNYRALLLALQGRHQEAEALVPSILEKAHRNRSYHHLTYDIARIYALGGKTAEGLKWLRVTVKEGFPCYTLFLRDSFLDRIRSDPDFVEFMTEQKTRWEDYKREFF